MSNLAEITITIKSPSHGEKPTPSVYPQENEKVRGGLIPGNYKEYYLTLLNI